MNPTPFTTPMDSADLIDHLPSLRRLAQRLVVDDDAAEDVLNEALAKARATARDVRDLPKYAAGVLRFVAKRRNRSDARRRHHEVAAASERPKIAPAADTIAERVEMMGAALEEIGRLPAAQSRAVGLRFVDDLPVKEIAAREGSTPSTVRSHLARGLATVRERLDARYGGRATWSSVLAPWALDAAPLAESGVDGTRATASAKVGAGSSTAALGGALLTMSTLKVLAVMAPVVLAATWFAQTQLDAAPSAADLTPETASAALDPSLAPVAAGEGARRNAGFDGVDRSQQSTGAPATPAEPSVETFPVLGRVVGASSGLPQPGVRVELTRLDDAAKGEQLAAITGKDGTFSLEDATLPSSELFVSFIDDASGFPIGTQHPVTFPLDADLVMPGPEALYFRVEGASTVDSKESLWVTPRRGSDITARSNPGEMPWVRFDETLPSEVSSLRLEAGDGFHFGTADLTSARGTVHDPVAVEFIAGGGVAFTAAAGQMEVSNAIRIRNIDAPAGSAQSLSLRPAAGAPEWTAEAKYLAPGDYTWEYRIGGASRTGSFTVHELTVTRTTIEAPEWRGSQIAIVIDASNAPDAPVDKWSFQALEESNVQSQMRAKVERTGTPESGLWTATLNELPPGSWHLVIGDVEGYTLSEQLIALEQGVANDPVIVMPASAAANATVRVVDDATGKLIPNARLWILTGLAGRPSESSSSGTFEAVELSGGEPSSLFASANGYQLAQLDYAPGSPANELTFRLVPGWRSRALVFDMSAQGFAKGIRVHVDGEDRGETDESGSLWFDGTNAPALVEVAKGQDTYEVLMDPFENGSAGTMDTPGYVFVVRSK